MYIKSLTTRVDICWRHVYIFWHITFCLLYRFFQNNRDHINYRNSSLQTRSLGYRIWVKFIWSLIFPRVSYQLPHWRQQECACGIVRVQFFLFILFPFVQTMQIGSQASPMVKFDHSFCLVQCENMHGNVIGVASILPCNWVDLLWEYENGLDDRCRNPGGGGGGTGPPQYFTIETLTFIHAAQIAVSQCTVGPVLIAKI